MDVLKYLHLQCNATLLNVQEEPEWSRKIKLLSLMAWLHAFSSSVKSITPAEALICTLYPFFNDSLNLTQS